VSLTLCVFSPTLHPALDHGAYLDVRRSFPRSLERCSLTTLLSIAQANVDTLLPLLMDSGNLTVFAPTNDVSRRCSMIHRRSAEQGSELVLLR